MGGVQRQERESVRRRRRRKEKNLSLLLVSSGSSPPTSSFPKPSTPSSFIPRLASSCFPLISPFSVQCGAAATVATTAALSPQSRLPVREQRRRANKSVTRVPACLFLHLAPRTYFCFLFAVQAFIRSASGFLQRPFRVACGPRPCGCCRERGVAFFHNPTFWRAKLAFPSATLERLAVLTMATVRMLLCAICKPVVELVHTEGHWCWKNGKRQRR